MNVSLINFTPFALETLIYTKNTRLSMDPSGFAQITSWPEEKKYAELEYMRHTIQSQFEFVDYIFSITGVSRAFTQQLQRHRVGTSFAQQSQRTVDMSGFEYITGPSIAKSEALKRRYRLTMARIEDAYIRLINGIEEYDPAKALNVGPLEKANIQDARGLLPTNIATNIVFKANLRVLHDMALKRLCVKAQGEFQDVFRAIREAVLTVHPWTEKFIRVWCATYGTCQFHTYPVEDCPTKPIVYNPDTGEAYGGGRAAPPDVIQIQWAAKRAEAQTRPPKVKEDDATAEDTLHCG